MVARDVAAVEDDLAGRWRVQADEQLRDGALAAAALADERRDRAGPEREADVVDRVHTRAVEQCIAIAEMLRQAAHFELSRAHPFCSTRWQATRCPAPIVRSTGRSVVWRAYSASSSVRQCGQRGWKRQPDGGAARSGGAPGMPVIRTSGPVSGGNDCIRPIV